MNATVSSTAAGPELKLSVGNNVFVPVKSLVERWGDLSSLEADLLGFGAVVYAADLAIKRSEREDFVRSIRVEVPVVNLAAFNAVGQKLERTLRVLSCDNWTLKFTAARGAPESSRDWPKATGTTLLFSGGLDSFAAACDLLGTGQEAYLVSHITHNRPIADSQKALVGELERHFGTKADHLQLMVSCRQFKDWSFPQDADREETQRTRSFLFVVLAAIAARMNGSRRLLVMAENGQFAIHLPLTAARVGAFSTHTAHPEFLFSMEDLLRELLLCPDLTLSNPFVHKTKTEVVELIPAKLSSSIEKSISCWMTSRLISKTHCGECVPCISRRLALEANGLWFNEYKRDIFRENFGVLAPDDNGKRNLSDLLEFIAHFHGPHSISEEIELCFAFPELFNQFVDGPKTIAMYRRFAKSASGVLRKYPQIAPLLK
jgi:7-cyano-7-deazaguanine synthase in queuosine biosynthesis